MVISSLNRALASSLPQQFTVRDGSDIVIAHEIG
jgi:hypothetical protein